jgi:Cu/Ag efflux protein CusF
MNAKATWSAAIVLAVMAASAGAQVSKTIPGETRTVTATVEAIEQATRQVTVKKSDSTYDVLYMPSSIKRFDTLKVGDRITARYYETIVLTMQAPGEKDADTSASEITRAENARAGTAAHQQVITATIAAIDLKTPSITFTGPRGWTYSSRVEDRKALEKVKVGDKVNITWTAAMTLSVEDAK